LGNRIRVRISGVGTRPFDAVLCDLDGVLRRWPDMSALDQAHGLPAGTLVAAAFAPERLLPALTGEQWRPTTSSTVPGSGSPSRTRASTASRRGRLA
jgi:putative hydrolase of the HAD superfamily